MSTPRRDYSKWIGVILFLIATGALVYYWSDVIRLFGSEEAIERTVESWGASGPLAFLLINVLQVIAAPIPGTAVGVAGGYLFGLWLGFLLNITGILIGSLAAFGLSRVYGKPLVDRFVGPRTAKFLERVANKNGIRGLALMFLLPFLPDDALCLMAGLTPIRTKTFIFIVLLGRSPGSFVASMTGSGLVDLPLWAWIIVGIVAIGLVVLWWLRGDAIEERMRSLFGGSQASETDTEAPRDR